MIKRFKNISSADISTCGGKWASLWELMRAWFPFSDGFVLTTEAFDVDHKKRKDKVYQAFDELWVKYVAVRSSATKEDGMDDSFAGQFDTYLFVDRESLIEQIIKCHHSINSNRIKAYCESKSIDIDEIQVAVVIQKMINSEVAWIAFTANPVTNNSDQVLIEWWYGLWEAIVSGMITPDNYLWSTSKQKILEKNTSTQSMKLVIDLDQWWVKEKEVECIIQWAQKLSNEYIAELAKISEKIEEHYNKPMDIERALEDGKLYILQARPITTIQRSIDADAKESEILQDWDQVEVDANNWVIKILNKNKHRSELFNKQISLSEWLEQIPWFDAKWFKKEDNEKRIRLAHLSEFINIAFDEPTSFPLNEVIDWEDQFKSYIDNHWDDLCALRLIPLTEWLPKLRMRGKSITDVVNWRLQKQDISNYNNYRADFVPHNDVNNRSTIFIIKDNWIYGEIIAGSHHYLTQWLYDDSIRPISFKYDFINRELSEKNQEALEHLQEISSHLHIKNAELQRKIEKKFNIWFSSNYLQWYFETVDSPGNWLWFIDWNRILQKHIEIPTRLLSNQAWSLSGQVCYWSGIISWNCIIIEDIKKVEDSHMVKNKILICSMTTPEYIPLIKKAKAVVTDKWWILSHAGIVCRELWIPCIVWVWNATKEIKDWDLIEIDASQWLINIIE